MCQAESVGLRDLHLPLVEANAMREQLNGRSGAAIWLAVLRRYLELTTEGSISLEDRCSVVAPCLSEFLSKGCHL